MANDLLSVTNERGNAKLNVSIVTRDPVSLTVTTDSFFTATSSSITAYGSVSTNKPGLLDEVGFCYNTTGSPTISNSKVLSSNVAGNFNKAISGLNRITTYYVVAYAIIGQKIEYGDVVAMNTIADLPIVRILDDSFSISEDNTEITISGSVDNDGGGPVVERWFTYQWEFDGVLTGPEVKLDGGAGTGEFTVVATGLQQQESYRFTAYARNAIGTSSVYAYLFTASDKIGLYSASQVVYNTKISTAVIVN